MSDNEAIVAVFGMLGAFSVIWLSGYLILAWIKAKAQRALPGDAVNELGAQLSRLQMSVDTMAIEIERISEAQRFTTKLLAERPDAARIERGGQPH